MVIICAASLDENLEIEQQNLQEIEKVANFLPLMMDENEIIHFFELITKRMDRLENNVNKMVKEMHIMKLAEVNTDRNCNLYSAGYS